MNDPLPPYARYNCIGRAAKEVQLRTAMADGALSHGWIIAGGRGAGKATIAYRIARGVLEPSALEDDTSFDVDPNSRSAKLVAQRAHPDLFVAERQWNEKTSKYQSEITVETIRQLNQFLSHTPAFGGARVAIIDTADDLNRNAANALLKILEEPPANTLLLLLSAAPGRLLPTIRSRCRRIDLGKLASTEIAGLLEAEGIAHDEEARRIADHAGGRPGYAISLALEGGAQALQQADAFLVACRKRGDIDKIANTFSARTSNEEWEFFTDAIASQLSDAARAAGRGAVLRGPLAGAATEMLVEGWEQVMQMRLRGDALNLDRAQIVSAMAFDLQRLIGDR